MPRRLITLALAATTSAVVLAGIAYGASVPWNQQDKQLVRACGAARRSIANAMNRAASAPSQTIESRLDVITPLTLWARIYFGSGGTLTVNGGDSFAGCARPVPRALGPQPARIVAALHETFPEPGRYTLTFRLNPVGQRLMARLGAARRAYHRRHPRGRHPPGMVAAVTLGYSPTG